MDGAQKVFVHDIEHSQRRPQQLLMIGTTLSHYSIESELGRGGMGIVYKARDTKLERDVAIKVLPAAALASEGDRARFYREAKAAAALNHPHIAAIHQIDEAVPMDADGNEINATDGPRPFIAMEFIEGRTLDAIIQEGPLQLEQAVKLTRQVAEALGMAHAKQIVHRDIKAGNIMVTDTGRAKVLDFGLAQTAHSTKLTRMGSTLGTVAYMSPEQARGEEVDGRSDLYSLGTVLYEMIAGRLPFGGEYEQAVVYGILNEDPEPLTALRTGVPMELELVVEKLLRKEARLRYQHVEGLIADLDALDVSAATASRSSGRTTMRTTMRTIAPTQRNVPAADYQQKGASWQTSVIMAVAALLMGALGMWFVTHSEPVQPRYHISPVEDLQAAVISPDGKAMAWFQADTLFYRPFSSPRATRLYESSTFRWLSWSPDSRSVAIVDGQEVRNIRVDGSGVFPIGDLPPSERIQGVVWTPGGRVFVSLQYGGANGEVFEFPASGGERSSYLEVRTSDGSYSILDLEWLPGPGVLIASTRNFSEDGIRVLKPQNEKEEELNGALIEATRTNVWIESIAYDPAGYVIYEREGDLWQLPIDPGSGMPRGETGVLQGGWQMPSVGANGTMLAHDFADPYARVNGVLIDPENGSMERLSMQLEGRVMYPVFHPDGSRVIMASPEGAKLASLERGDAQRISSNFAVISQWINDRVLIVSDYSENGNANVMTLDPTSRTDPEILVETDDSEFYGEVSPDGTTLIYYRVAQDTGRDLWTVPVTVDDSGIRTVGAPESWFSGPNDDAAPTWHPSGEWVAYMSNETGRFQVYVRSYPDGRTTELVSLGEGMTPLWSEDGRDLYYRDTDSLYVVTSFEREGRLRFFRPRALLSLDDVGMVLSTALERSIAVRPGTGELLFFQSAAVDTTPSIVVVENRLGGS